jgi:hypothetical protein
VLLCEKIPLIVPSVLNNIGSIAFAGEEIIALAKPPTIDGFF